LKNQAVKQARIKAEELDIIGKYQTPLAKLDMIRINVTDI
jgi:hypothetical protein